MIVEGIDPRDSATKQEIPTVSDYFHNHYIEVAKTLMKTWRHDVQGQIPGLLLAVSGLVRAGDEEADRKPKLISI
nr:hypothetical protein OAM_15675 [Vibrio cyclitrophicus ZF14]